MYACAYESDTPAGVQTEDRGERRSACGGPSVSGCPVLIDWREKERERHLYTDREKEALESKKELEKRNEEETEGVEKESTAWPVCVSRSSR